MKIWSPAKLNIRLKVTGLRPDGYHELVSIMVPVDLFDIIELKKEQKQGIVLFCEGRSVPDNSKNLVFQAAESFFSRTGLPKSLSIKLRKNIPVAAGLGGGSSNAAFTLKALNEIWGNPLTLQDIKEMAVNLGADVPFFLHHGPCIARGIGEVLEPIKKWQKFWYVIVMPPLQISTAWVYSNFKLKLTKDEYRFIISNLAENPSDVVGLLENDLESVTALHYPVIRSIKNALVDAGAEGALMSGSGPSVFGVFKSKAKAQRAKGHLSSQNLGEVFSVVG